MAQTEYEKELTRRKKKDEETKYNQWLDTQRQDKLFQEDKLNNQTNRFATAKDAQTRASMFELEQKKYNDAADSEYYRKKAAFDVRAGNMDQGTFDTLYGGGGQGGQSGGGRGMRGGGQGGDPDYSEMITKAYANKPKDDMRSFADFARDEMGLLRRDNPFPQTQQPMSTSDMYKAGDLRNRMNFEQNVQSSRGYDGKLRFSDNAASPILGGAATQAQGWDASRTMAQNRMSMFAGSQNQPTAYDPSMEQKRAMGTTRTTASPVSTGSAQAGNIRSKIGLNRQGAISTVPVSETDKSEQDRKKRLRGGYIDSPFKSMYR